MWYRVAADAVLVLHLAFIFYIVGGGVLVWRWPWTKWLHLPCVFYGAAIEFIGWVCPLTPLENQLRRAAGDAGFEGGFVEHYIVPIIYPADYTPTLQILLGSAVVAINLVTYGIYVFRVRKQSID